MKRWIALWIALLGVLMVGGGAVGLFGLGLLPQSGSSGDWPDFITAARLVNASGRIVVARYEGEATHMIDVLSTAGEKHGSVSEIYRKFTVVESLKGDVAAGETTHVVFTAGSTDASGISETYETVPLSQGQSYVLFLEGFPRRSEYPAQYGATIWTIVGEPGIA